jgi:hypothetical protein
MFTESEIATMVDDEEILNLTKALKREFLKKEAPMMEIIDHDFYALIMLTPSVSIALANGTISLFEELSLNKKARRFSKGGYFLKTDPVIHAMKFLIMNFDYWEDKFYEVILLTIDKFFGLKNLLENNLNASDEIDFTYTIMQSPYVLVRSLPSFFLPEDEEITNLRSISEVEYEKLLEIGRKLKLEEIPAYQKFVKTFEIK